MGVIFLSDHDREGIAFRVWAPHADQVCVTGDFNDWSDDAAPMTAEDNGHWYAEVPEAKAGDEYKFVITNGENTFHRIDPRAREVTNSIGNGVIYRDEFDWEDDQYSLPPWNELVIYEMHLGTYSRDPEDPDAVGDFDSAIANLDHLQELGINVVQLMPVAEFAGDQSWGYNPAHIYAVESAYGGPDALKRFVLAAHKRGIGVMMDVVYNHFGPSDLDIWQFDGWSENDKGGIYFYNDHRSNTPWGDTRPDYGRPEVRAFIRDNAMMWLDEFRGDGLRYDMTVYIRSVDGNEDIPEGWSLAQWINDDIKQHSPWKIQVAEDLHQNEWLTKPKSDGGANFDSQWDAAFVHPVRDVLTQMDDEHRSMGAIASAVQSNYNGDWLQRVIYTESHDEVANGKSRVPAEIDEEDQRNWFAQKRSCLGAVLVMTSPGIPMLFQGQEFLIGGFFDDSVPLDWSMAEDFSGIVALYRHLIRLRRNQDGCSRGLSGGNVSMLLCDDAEKVVVYHRWNEGGPNDDVVVVINFSSTRKKNFPINFPHAGKWRLQLNSDYRGYSAIFGDEEAFDIEVTDGSQPAGVTIAPYSALIYSRES